MDHSGVQELLSRDEVLAGLPARRASTALLAIESRTAQAMARTREAASRLPTERTAEQRERAFLSALAHGRAIPVPPTIQDLERYAAEWASLVPSDPGVRAAVAGLLATKFAFAERNVPRLRGALGLDTPTVGEAYARQHHTGLASIYTTKSSSRERRRWMQSRVAHWLESLPPFWTVFALTLTEMVGAAILALPTAVAGVGPLAGVGLLLVLGLVNMVTIAALSEAFVRDGNVRYGHTYFGRLVATYLGGAATSLVTRLLLGVISVLLMADCVGALLAYSIGLSTTLARASGVSALVWAVLLLGVVLYVLRRQTLNLTIASALAIGAINVGVLVLMALLALPHVSAANLVGTNLVSVSSGPFDPALLGLTFGVIMAAYFGHFSTGTCARLVLGRDPSGRSLIQGNIAAISVAMVLNCLWVVVMNGTLAPAALVNESGTAIDLLAAEVGPIISVLGVVFVILGMGMGAIHSALALTYQMREWRGAERIPGLDAMPVVMIFGLAAWLLTTDASFARSLGVLGVVAYSVLGGMLPALLLIASRRKGEYVPAIVLRVVGHPLVLGTVYALFTASFFVHGLLIWTEPLERVASVAVGLVLLITTAVAIKCGAFTARVVVELRIDTDDEMSLTVTERGQRRVVRPEIHYGIRRSACVELPPTMVRQLKVWVHRLTATGDSAGLDARVELCQGSTPQLFDLTGQAVVAITGAAYRVSVVL